MDVYKVEDQRIEDIKAWWRENGLSIVISVALGVGAIFGWRAWQASTLEKAQAASQLHAKMVAALRDEDDAGAKDAADGILGQYDNTAYAVFARLTLAKLAVADGELDAAAARLREALDQDLDESFSHVARLRLIRVLLSQGELDEAERLAAAPDQGEFAVNYEELKGDIKSAQGDLEAARDAYQQSLSQALGGARDVSTLEIKIDNIGG